MSLYPQPDPDLSENERLLAEVIMLGHRIPCGGQMTLVMHLDSAIAQVDELFTERQLPHRDELLNELRRWKEHAEQGLAFSQACDRLMGRVIRSVDSTVRG
jgi:hypothetical protein